ncbi:serpin family protein [Endozoicomonas sp. ALD040]|uniref:serpin family protein n=1 Tax=unclassified Endozoicomonas TaxID=2644528 RepID=UPI003BAEC059
MVLLSKYSDRVWLSIKALTQTTLHSLFTNTLSLGTMLSEPVPVLINVFNQHSAIEVNEQGTEAAAVTHIGCSRGFSMNSPKPIEFTRPFIYILRNKITKKSSSSGKYLIPGNQEQVLQDRVPSNRGWGSLTTPHPLLQTKKNVA